MKNKFVVGGFTVPRSYVLVPALSVVVSLLHGVSTGFVGSALLALVVTMVFTAVDNLVVHPNSFSFTLGRGLLANFAVKTIGDTVLLLVLAGVLSLIGVHVGRGAVAYPAALLAWLYLCWEGISGFAFNLYLKVVTS